MMMMSSLSLIFRVNQIWKMPNRRLSELLSLINKRSQPTILTLAILILLCSFFMGPITCDAAILWSDDFDDGNYDGWTVALGNYSISDNTLHADGEGWNRIIHSSTVARGTWSLDLYIPDEGWCDILCVVDSLNPEYNQSPIHGFGLSFRNTVPNPESVLHMFYDYFCPGFDIYAKSSGFTGWTHIDITWADNEQMYVYYDEVRQMEDMDSRSSVLNVSSYFVLEATTGVKFDNISVSDTIDVTQVWPPPFEYVVLFVGLPVALVVFLLIRRASKAPV